MNNFEILAGIKNGQWKMETGGSKMKEMLSMTKAIELATRVAQSTIDKED
jgi:hypothetical protein